MWLSKDKGGMGFRDLVSFNKALLAKQCWRLFQSPKSLTTTIIKAKYYPNTSFMDAKLGTKPSFAWRSIQGARDLIEAGTIWRIGNGQSINIWGDNWIQIPTTYRVQSRPKVLDPSSKVFQLFDQEMVGWDKNLLRSIFTSEEIAAINTKRISQTHQPGLQIWRCTNSDIFLVKSAYHLEKELEMRKSPAGSTRREESILWKTMWKLSIPNVAKSFFLASLSQLVAYKG